MNRTVRTQRRWALCLLACAALLVGVLAGCSSSKSSGPSSAVSADQKAMIEAVANWYKAQGTLDMAGFKAGIYDPDNILGVATMTTAPPGATKADVSWSWVGDSIVVLVPSQESTITMSASPTKPDLVVLKDAKGQQGAFVMKKMGDVWKIDVTATQDLTATQQQGGATEGSSTGTSSTP